MPAKYIPTRAADLYIGSGLLQQKRVKAGAQNSHHPACFRKQAAMVDSGLSMSRYKRESEQTWSLAIAKFAC